MTKQDISGHILVLKSAINCCSGRELSNEDSQILAASGLALLECFLTDINNIAAAIEFEVSQREQERRNK